MARFTTTGGSGDGTPGTPGAPGADGADGADALWNFTGAWVNGVDYAAGSVVEFQGSTYYHPNGQFSSYSPPTNGWLLVSAKGADGADGLPGSDGSAGSSFGIYYLGNYNPSSGYVPDIAVVRGSDGQLYLAKASGQLGDPVGNSAEWEVWIPKGADGTNGTNGTNANTGDITFDGSRIIGAGTGAGDGSGNGTIELVPDGDITSNQYLVIDPTSPNHIHIRAGGIQDASSADLFIGGERTGVQVSDGSGNVIIRSKNPDRVDIYANSNQASNTEFMVATGANILVGDTVHLYTGGDNFVVTAVTQEYPYAGLMTVVADGLSFVTGESYTFSRNMGEDRWVFEPNGVTFPDNTVQTTAFIGGATGTFETPDSKLVTVANGIIVSIDPLT